MVRGGLQLKEGEIHAASLYNLNDISSYER